MSRKVKVANFSDLMHGQHTCYSDDRFDILVVNLDTHIYALDNTCTHAGACLSDGHIEGDEIVCPWHGAAFNVKTGIGSPPARAPIKTYPVHLENGDILVELPD